MCKSSNYAVYLKFTVLYVNYSSIKLKEKKRSGKLNIGTLPFVIRVTVCS